ncbi:hypothetical protein ACS0TY_014034 [Phlomoides rotata]
MEDGTDLVSRLLRVSHVAATNELRTARACAYMMYAIGCVLFADKSRARVGTYFLRIMDDVEDASKKWVPPSRARVNFEDQVSLRERLDAVTVSDVEWNPNAGVREQHPLEEIVFFHGCIRSFDIAEPYHPDHVLRQFGYVQTIPAAPLGPMFASRPAKGGPISGNINQ